MSSKSHWWLAVAAGVLLLFYGAVGYLETAGMVGDNPRWRGMNRGPRDFGLQGETVSFSSPDGVPLKAWWLPAPGAPRGTVIIGHGIDHTRQVMLPRSAFLVHGGYNVLAIDFRGHGESGGRVVSTGYLEARDLLGAVGFVRKRRDTGPIALMGVSYGAVAALLAASESPEVSAVIADGAFPTGKDVFEDISRHFVHDQGTNPLIRAVSLIAFLPGVTQAAAAVYYLRTGVWLGTDLFSVIPSVSRLRIPVLLISGERDWIVPTDRARQIFSAIRVGQKRLVMIPGAVHDDTTYSSAPALYENAVLNFLANGYDQSDGRAAGTRFVGPGTQ